RRAPPTDVVGRLDQEHRTVLYWQDGREHLVGAPLGDETVPLQRFSGVRKAREGGESDVVRAIADGREADTSVPRVCIGEPRHDVDRPDGWTLHLQLTRKALQIAHGGIGGSSTDWWPHDRNAAPDNVRELTGGQRARKKLGSANGGSACVDVG